MRFELDLLILMYKKAHRRGDPVRDEDPENLGSQTRLRADPTLPVVRPTSAKFLKPIAYLGPKEWHSLPSNVRLISDPFTN